MEKENIMGTKKILPLLISLGLPPMISMLIQSLYNIIDSIFVASLGENALTAVSLVYPLQNITLAVSVGLGVGINSVVARGIGSQNHKEVNSASTHAFVLTAIHSLIFVCVGLFLSEPFLRMFTSDSEILSWGIDYSRIVVCLTFGQLFHIYIEKLFQAVGNVVMPMIMQIVGAVVNVILDPILIFGYFGFPAMGVKGAAIATVIGQISACIISFILFKKSNTGIELSFKNFKWDNGIVKKIYAVAIPSSLLSAMPSLLVTVLNSLLASISQTAVAVFGLYYKVQNFVYMPACGIIQGMRPIVGYNYGAKKYDRIHETIHKCILLIGGIMALGTVLFLLVPDVILSLFSASDHMLEMGEQAFRIICLGFIPSTIGVVLSGVFEALGKGNESLTISLLRQMTIIPILSLLFKDVFGVQGIWFTFVIAESVGAIVSFLLYKYRIKV